MTDPSDRPAANPAAGDAPLPFIPPAPPAFDGDPARSSAFGDAALPPPPLSGPGFAVPAAPVSSLDSGTTGVPASGGWGRWLWVVVIPVIALITFSGGVAMGQSGILGPAAIVAESPAPASATADMALIQEAWDTIHENYVDAKHLDDQELAYGAIRGMTEAVGDEGHTSFLTADEARAADQSLSGTFVGIGVQINTEQEDGGPPVVSSIIPNTPAEESDLKRGDRIISVDGWETDGHTVEEVVSRVRGPEGAPVTLTIGRDGRADFEVTITRRQFDLPLVTWSMVPGRDDVAMVRLEQFATGATKALEGAINDAKAAGATKLVLDLRGNPGGYVNEAIG